ncbi:MAG TPA: hypothetical protein P5293_01305 [Bacteroidales bacterium]|nr:hypothetical protein [Bacteroidales bacterium]
MKRNLTRKTMREDFQPVLPYHDKKIAEVARKMGITRQAASQTLKRALKKFYFCVQKLDETWTPFQVALIMAKMLNQDHSIKEMRTFIRLLPRDIGLLIWNDAMKRMPGALIEK